jgi:hypothetical protein
MRCTLASFVVVTLLMMQAPSTGAKGIELDSREYKLMLEPAHFAGSTPAEAVDEFLRDQMEGAIRESFGGAAPDELARKRHGPREAPKCPVFGHARLHPE